MTTIPTAIEIISLYLYGQKTPPDELKSELLVRPEGAGENPAYVDVNEYMTSGGGRFVKLENFNYVRNFLAAKDYDKELAPGIYTRDQLLMAYGKSGQGKLGITQYFLGMSDADYQDRAYVFGSGEFEINPDAQFVVNQDGSREILDIAVVPVNDNFDYDSRSWPAIVTNALTVDRIDPSGIGRQVPIIFEGKIANTVNLTGEDWYAMDESNTLDPWGLWVSMTMIPHAIVDFAALMVKVAASGVIDSKTPEASLYTTMENHPVIMGGLMHWKDCLRSSCKVLYTMARRYCLALVATTH